MIKIAPSILSADFSRLAEEIKMVEDCGADLLHMDIMDGCFVPNITFGPHVISSLRDKTKLPFDVHLMIEEPERYIDEFVTAGADILTVHIENNPHLHRLLSDIKGKGVKAGIALNPSTSLDRLQYVLDIVDLVLIMSVDPGFGGQEFISGMTGKVKELKNIVSQRGLDVLIEVDGGINENNSVDIVNAGADILVAGSAIYKSLNPKDVITKLKKSNF